MTFVVGTVAYPASRPFLHAWARSVAIARDIVRPAAVSALVVADTLDADDVQGVMKAEGIDAMVVPAFAGATIPGTRELLFRALAAKGAALAVFCDSDDELEVDAFAIHSEALGSADVSVGDMVPIDIDGTVIGGPVFGEELPTHFARDTLDESNVCGLSNTALRLATTREDLARPVPNVIAVDWWLHAGLLARGRTIVGTRRVVARYRQHGANTIGACSANSLESARRRLSIVSRHLEATGRRTEAAAALELAGSTERLAKALSTVVSSRAWHADAIAWCRADRPRRAD